RCARHPADDQGQGRLLEGRTSADLVVERRRSRAAADDLAPQDRVDQPAPQVAPGARCVERRGRFGYQVTLTPNAPRATTGVTVNRSCGVGRGREFGEAGVRRTMVRPRVATTLPTTLPIASASG